MEDLDALPSQIRLRRHVGEDGLRDRKDAETKVAPNTNSEKNVTMWVRYTIGAVAVASLTFVVSIALFPVFLFFLPCVVLAPLIMLLVPAISSGMGSTSKTSSVRCVQVWRRSDTAGKEAAWEMVEVIDAETDEEVRMLEASNQLQVRVEMDLAEDPPQVRVAMDGAEAQPRDSDVYVRVDIEGYEEMVKELRRAAGE